MTARPAPLPVATPSSVGVDAAGILRLLDALEASPTQEPHGLMILRHGRIIAEGWWAPYTPTRQQHVYSLSKSFTAAAAGVLYDEGRLDLDAPVISFFPEFADEITDPRSRRILVRHVASMSTGHTREMLDIAVRTDRAEPVRGFLLNPPDQEPGTVFAYSQPTTYTLAAIVQRLTGRTLVEFLRERVLGPLGADEIAWTQGPPGRDIGFSGAFVTTDTIARLGQLLLRGGDWNGRRILSEEWVRLATSPQIATASGSLGDAASDWARGYGFQHWVSRHGFRGDGAFGQYCLVLPEQDAVIAYQGQASDMQETLDAMWDHLLPAFGAGGATPGGRAADEELADRLARASLPPLHVDPFEPDAGEWDGAVFDACEGGGLSARVERSVGGWRVVLTGSTGDVEAGLVTGPDAPLWYVTEGPPAVAVSGGFTSPHRLALDVAFLETPHRLHVVLALDPGSRGPARTGQAMGRWEVPPLGDEHDLVGLAAPDPFG